MGMTSLGMSDVNVTGEEGDSPQTSGLCIVELRVLVRCVWALVRRNQGLRVLNHLCRSTN